MTNPTLDEAQIREAAYLLWLDEGQPQGRDQEHWLRAIDALTPAAPKAKPARKASSKPRTAKPKAAATKTKTAAAATKKADAKAAPAAKKPRATKTAKAKAAKKD